jgi:primary-amine oxidase
MSVELLMPNKTDILPFLSNSYGSLERNAFVTIMFGATEEPYVQEFTVGPLPITNASTVQPYTFRNNNGGEKLRVYNPDSDGYANLNKASMKEAEDVTKLLWNLVSTSNR